MRLEDDLRAALAEKEEEIERLREVLRAAHDVLKLRAQEMTSRGDGPYYTLSVMRAIERFVPYLAREEGR